MKGWKTAFAIGLMTLAGSAHAQETDSRHLYVVPGVHYGTPSRASVSLTAFLDGRRGVVGKGNILILEGGPDAVKAQFGLANVSQSPMGYSTHVGFLRTRMKPLEADPNSSYAGAEFHVYLSVVNLGTGFYAPVGAVKGRHGLLHLSIGLGF